MIKKTDTKIFKIETEKISNPLMRAGVGLTKGLIEHTLCFPQLNDIYLKSQEAGKDLPISFSRRILLSMNIGYTVNSANPNPIPSEGPVVVVANHPFGGIEGVVMLAMLEDFRSDFKVMANYLLSSMPELHDYFIFVDPFGGKKAAASNFRPLKESLGWLRNGGVLGVFPAGEVSSVDLQSGKVRDPAWSSSIAALVRKTKASVVPVFFSGHNGPLFNLAGMIHPRLRTMMLPKQLIKKRDANLSIQIGQCIPWEEMEDYATDDQLIQYLRLRTYILSERASAASHRHPALPSLKRLKRKKRLERIIDPDPPEDLAAEIAELPSSLKLLEAKEMDVYLCPADRIPRTLREIGRLREITFREVGEGTGKEIDLDRFDEYYLHLFIWNHVKSEIAGAYRLGLADEIMDKHGVKGLYTHTCFRFKENLMEQLQPAVELGRSFVRPEYQKAFSSLLLLWRGICAFLIQNPRYVYLFGPVSITNEYRDASRNLLLRSLRLSNFEQEMARLVKPRRRPRRPRRAEWNLPDFHPYIDNPDLVAKLIQEIESDQKGIPVLLRQYLRMGGRLLAFNVDPSFNFALDGLIAVNLLRCDPIILGRYMGMPQLKEYWGYHGIDLDEALNDKKTEDDEENVS